MRKKNAKRRTKKAARPRVQSLDSVFAGVHHKSGRLATIEDVIASDVHTRMGRDLSLPERVRLATHRLRKNQHFVPMIMLGATGVIDKARALREIKRLTPIGLHLLDIDMRHSRLQIEQSLAARTKKGGDKDASRDNGRN
jgi:hypothetical protein